MLIFLYVYSRFGVSLVNFLELMYSLFFKSRQFHSWTNFCRFSKRPSLTYFYIRWPHLTLLWFCMENIPINRTLPSPSDYMCAIRLCCYEAKRSNLELKTRFKPLLGHLPLDIALPVFLALFLFVFIVMLPLL